MRIRKRRLVAAAADSSHVGAATLDPPATSTLLVPCQDGSAHFLHKLLVGLREGINERCSTSGQKRLQLDTTDDGPDLPIQRSLIGCLAPEKIERSETGSGESSTADVSRSYLDRESLTAKDSSCVLSAVAHDHLDLSSSYPDTEPEGNSLAGGTDMIMLPVLKPKLLPLGTMSLCGDGEAPFSILSQPLRDLEVFNDKIRPATQKRLRQYRDLEQGFHKMPTATQCHAEDSYSVESELGYFGGFRKPEQIRKRCRSVRPKSCIPAPVASFKGIRSSSSCFNKATGHGGQLGAKESICLALHLMLGSDGLTVGDATSKMLKQGYVKLFKADSLPRSLQIARTLRSDPHLLSLSDGKFLTFENAGKTGNQKKFQNLSCCNDTLFDCSDIILQDAPQDDQETNNQNSAEKQYPNFRRERKTDGLVTNNGLQAAKQNISKHVTSSCRPPPLAASYNGQQCNRKDGRGWQCSRMAKEGCTYCEHHLVKIKANHARSAMKLARMKAYRKGKKPVLWEASTDSVSKFCLFSPGEPSSDATANDQLAVEIDDNGRGINRGEKRRGTRRRCFKSLQEIGESAAAIANRSSSTANKEAAAGGGDVRNIILCLLNSDPTEWRKDLF